MVDVDYFAAETLVDLEGPVTVAIWGFSMSWLNSTAPIMDPWGTPTGTEDEEEEEENGPGATKSVLC